MDRPRWWLSAALSAVSAACGEPSPSLRTDERLAEFVRLGGRTNCLDLPGEGITDAGLQVLQGYEGIRGVWLRACSRVDGSGFGVFATMPGMRDVTITNCTLQSDVAFDFLRSSESVRELILNDARVDDRALSDIAASKSLEILRLRSIDALTDQGLISLAGARNLRLISIARCREVSQEAVERLRHALPECRIEYEP